MNSDRTSHRIIIAGGGTGGHVFPALAIAEALRAIKTDIKIIFAGTSNGIEARLIPAAGEELRTIWISGFSRKQMLSNLALPLKLAASLWQSRRLMAQFRPHVVIGTGGYVMGPVLWVAQHLHIPTVIQEQNSFPGYTTRRLAGRASLICAGFADVQDHLPVRTIRVTGNPLREAFQTIDRERARRSWNLDFSRRTLLVFGGSAGARSINQAIASDLKKMLEQVNIIWQTGRLGVPETADRETIEIGVGTKRLIIREFVDNMNEAYAVADLAVCRAGAMTLAELAMMRLPAVLVPYPFATNDHQNCNAKSFVKGGGAVLVNDADLCPGALASIVSDLLSDTKRLQSMTNSIGQFAHPDAAQDIARLVIELAEAA